MVANAEGFMYEIKVGDLVWQSRQPGGWCIVVDVTEWDEDQPMGWLQVDYPIYKVAHPTEGIIEDASYYYHTVEEHQELINRVWKDGRIIGYKDGFEPSKFFDQRSDDNESG